MSTALGPTRKPTQRDYTSKPAFAGHSRQFELYQRVNFPLGKQRACDGLKALSLTNMAFAGRLGFFELYNPYQKIF